MNLNDCIELMRLLQEYKTKTKGAEQQRIVHNMEKVDALGKTLAQAAHVNWKW
jgi:hypothetical protein